MTGFALKFIIVAIALLLAIKLFVTILCIVLTVIDSFISYKL